MPKVENKKILNKIIKESFKANRVRNIFAIMSVILTTLMFTILFTILMSMKSSIEGTSMRQSGSSAHGTFKNLNIENIEEFKNSKLIKEFEYSRYLANAENEQLEKRMAEIRYGTLAVSEFFFSKPTKGTMPEKINEVAMDKILLDYLGIEANIGNEVELEYTLNGEKQRDKFILSGYWEGDIVTPASMIWISNDYIQLKLKEYKRTSEADNTGKISGDVKFDNSKNIEGNMEKVLIELGYGVGDIDYGVNWAYMGSKSLDLSVIITLIVAIIFIMISGYLIIYNIFFISISKDIKFYGLLKTIGTTSKQIKTIIVKEGVIISLIAIPMGLLIGYLVAIAVVPLVLRQMNILVSNISIDPLIFLAAGIFALITVLVSIRKPARIAAKVSPIEAIKTADGNISKKGLNKSHKFNKIYLMALGNVFRNKKRLIFVVASIALSLVIFNSTYVVVNSFDMDKYISRNLKTDFLVANSNYFNVANSSYSEEKRISKEFIEIMKSIETIDEIGIIKHQEEEINLIENLREKINNLMLENSKIFTGVYKEMALSELAMDKIMTHVYSLDEMAIKQLEVIEGDLDFEKLKTGKYIIASSFSEGSNGKLYEIGEKVIINSKEYEVMAIANIPFNLSVRHGHSFGLEFFMAENEFINSFGEKDAMVLLANGKSDKIDEIESFIKNFTENIEKDMNYQSKKSFEKEFKSMENSFKGIGILLSIILAIIGIMNFTNTVITSIVSRKKEFAILESIGMTKKQIRKTLITESLIYITLSAIVALSLGNLLSYIGIKIIVKEMWFFTLNFTIVAELLALMLLILIAILITILIVKFFMEESIVEKLRNIE